MTEIRDSRGLIREIVARLQQVDEQVAELAESLPLPPDVTEMWEFLMPTSPTAYLYAALETVRCDYLQEAIETLLDATRQTEVSLRSAFVRGQRPFPPGGGRPPAAEPAADLSSSGDCGKSGVSFRKAPNTPGLETGRKEPPLC